MKKQKTKEQKKKDKQSILFLEYGVFLAFCISLLCMAGMGYIFLAVMNGTNVIGAIGLGLICVSGGGYVLYNILDTWYLERYNKIK